MKDVQKKRKPQSRGYKKIEGFYRFFREDNARLKNHVTIDLKICGWIWIDTPCINKRSSAEVSESVTSMFGWYSRDLERIAYLADVPCLSIDREAVMSDFGESEHFTRNRILQELYGEGVISTGRLKREIAVRGIYVPTLSLANRNEVKGTGPKKI